MSTIKQYFTSPQKMVSLPLKDTRSNLKTDSVTPPPMPPSTSSTTAELAAATASPRTVNNCRKLIASNMASVISSVKKQRKAKKKKRETVEPDICDISNILSNNLCFVSPTTTCDGIPEEVVVVEPGAAITNGDDLADAARSPVKTMTKPASSPRKKKTASRSKDKSSKENKISVFSIKPANDKQSPRTNHKEGNEEVNPASENVSTSPTIPKKNAFELLMTARNKTIGSNSPGKEANERSPSMSCSVDASKKKRKLLLEEWAERKGGAKRKVQDVEEEQYINHQMEKRAKRLKKLIKNGSKTKPAVVRKAVATSKKHGKETVEPQSCENSDEEKEEDEAAIGDSSLNGSFVKFNFKKFGKPHSDKKHKKSKKRINELHSDDDEEHTTTSVKPKEKTPKNGITVNRYRPLELSTVKSDVAHDNNKVSPGTSKSPKLPSPPSSGTKLSATKSKNDSFVQVLSSPIKKRDSLLGYFSKIAKTPTSDDSEPLNTKQSEILIVDDDSPSVRIVSPTKKKKKRGRPLKSKESISQMMPAKIRETTPTRSVEVAPETNSSGRPKRVCRDKVISYKIDQDNSPAKVAAQKSLKRARRLLSGGSSPSTSPKKVVKALKPNPNTKLAPIFVKALPKPIIDPEIARARQQFLMSGIPEKMKLEIERQRTYEETFEIEVEIFPTISHVTQLSINEDTPVSYDIKFRNDPSDDDSMLPINYQNFKCGAKVTDDIHVNKLEKIRRTVDGKLEFPKKLVKSLKEDDTFKFPYFRCYKQLHKKSNIPIDEVFGANGNVADHDDVVDDEEIDVFIINNDSTEASIQIIEDSISSVNGNFTFTDKYRPCISDEILVNTAPVLQLKKFLSTWQENYSSTGKCYDSSDDDDFDRGSSASGLGSSALNKAIILCGPSGSGKTNAVFALAQELNFKVLEINAGGKRTGKRILQELQEATQSHQVKGGSSGSSGDKLFKSQSQVQSSEESSSGYGVSQATQQLSLILIEDADIVFEQDNGFTDAIYQLVATSKRPVILVANQRNCSHLQRFIEHNAIEFFAHSVPHISMWLSTLTIAERCYVDREQCKKLYVHNNFDLRKTMLELQLYVQSGGDSNPKKENGHYRHNTLYEFYTRNQNQSFAFPFPVDFDVVRERSREIVESITKETEMANDGSRDALNHVVDFYTFASSAQRIQSWRNCNDRTVNILSEDMAHDMMERLVQGRKQKLYIEPTPKNKFVEIRDTLAEHICNGGGAYHVPGITITNRAIHLDVEPSLRTICRSEKIRTQTERRSSRFYHYLRNAVTSSFSTDVFDVHCTLFDN